MLQDRGCVLFTSSPTYAQNNVLINVNFTAPYTFPAHTLNINDDIILLIVFFSTKKKKFNKVKVV